MKTSIIPGTVREGRESHWMSFSGSQMHGIKKKRPVRLNSKALEEVCGKCGGTRQLL